MFGESLQFLLFMNEDSLDDFRRADGWEIGVDGSVTLVNIGAAGSLDTTNISDPIVAFVLAVLPNIPGFLKAAGALETVSPVFES